MTDDGQTDRDANRTREYLTHRNVAGDADSDTMHLKGMGDGYVTVFFDNDPSDTSRATVAQYDRLTESDSWACEGFRPVNA